MYDERVSNDYDLSCERLPDRTGCNFFAFESFEE